MHVNACVTTISWIPSEAIRGMTKMPFKVGIAHYDEAPPDEIGADGAALVALRDADRFRFANRLEVDVEFDDDGTPVRWQHLGGGMIGSTTMRLGSRSTTFEAVALDDVVAEPEIGDGFVRFTQTAGGRTGVPAPRRVSHAPFVQWQAPLAWSTLQLTVRADGTSDGELVGASPFPRHWVYGDDGTIVAKSGLVDFTEWYHHAFGKHSPWGDNDSPALAVAVETALERDLATTIMHGDEKPRIDRHRAGTTLLEQGATGSDVLLLLDGVVSIDVDGTVLAELGPGAVLGERAALEGGTRTATVRAITRCKSARIPVTALETPDLVELSIDHRREEE